MFAIFKSGGKQYKAKAGDIIKLEKLEGAPGSTLQLDNVLLFGGKQTQIGDAASKGKLQAEILEQTKGDKVIVFKKKRRHNYRRKNGHRQLQTVVRITEITSPDGQSVKAEPYTPKQRKVVGDSSNAAAKPANKVAEKASTVKAASSEKVTKTAATPAKKAAKAKVSADDAAEKPKKAATAKASTAEKKTAKPASSKKKES